MSLLLAISVLSAAVIGYEILLMRLLSIIQWHHFAYMIISLALLGFGASGTFIALAREHLLARFHGVFAAGAGLFGVTAVGCFVIVQQLPFNPLEIVWDPWQPLYLLAIYLLLAVPFFFAATCIGLTLVRFGDRINVIYFADLSGAGAGALAVIGLLFWLPPTDCLLVLGSAGLAAAALALFDWHGGRRWGVVLAGAAVALPFLWPEAALDLRPSPYKELSQARNMPGVRVVQERSSPLGMLSVIESPTVPLRHAPGFSLLAAAPIPEQMGIFTDGGAMSAITRYGGERDSLRYLDFQTAALPFHLLSEPKVLVLGAGAGADVLLALYHRAPAVDAVELNPQMLELVRGTYGAFAGGLYRLPEVRVFQAEARGFLTRSRERYDLIHVALLDSFSASSAGLHALSESNLYTVEALATYLRRLAPGGYLSLTRWLKLPPRDSLKLFATAAAALERLGVPDPGKRLALIRSWNTTTLIVKNGVLSAAETAAVSRFAGERGFDVAYHPGITREAVNRLNILERPYLNEGAMALLGPNREAYLEAYKFQVAPATDDRPYFFHFFKWRLLPELFARRGAGGLQLVEWGYLILVATLAQAAVVSLVLVLLPLGLLRRASFAGSGAPAMSRVAGYFLLLGFAFFFVEIAFMQRFTLFLSHPLYAVAVVLCAFLVFAGLGSAASARLAIGVPGLPIPGLAARPIVFVVGGIAVLSAVYLALLPVLFEQLIHLPTVAKVAVSAALIAPLAFLMGMPFPLGLRRVSDEAPALVPWAWAINGCASVLSAVLATVLAIHFGFTVVVGLALILYLLAGVVFDRRRLVP